MIPRCFESGHDFFAALERDRPDVLVTDIRMPDMSGLELMERLATTDPDVPVIVITAHSDLDSAVSAYQGGAFEYLPKPFDIDEAIELVSRAARQRSRGFDRANRGAPNTANHRPGAGHARGVQGDRTPVALEHDGADHRRIGHRARSSSRALCTTTLRAHVAPFVALNTSAIAAELLESELFGHEKGAFTGATERRIGRFEQANGGTLFLDEIGDMSLALQTRLLRVLAESEFFRVGGQTPIRVDVRVIAATHQELAQACGYRSLPRGPVSPPQRHAHRGAAAAPTARGHSGARPVLPRAGRERARRGAEDAERGRRRASCRSTTGPATCASS